jgi:hypothetical protein
MENLQLILLFAVAISVVYVWVFRYHNVLKEFEQFGLGDTTRNLVGASKIILATLLVVGVWHPSLIFIPSILMALFMLSAQYFHFKVKNPFIQKLPSLVLLIFCLALAYFNCPS